MSFETIAVAAPTANLSLNPDAPPARRLAWFVRRHRNKWRHYERRRSVRQLPVRGRRLQSARAISPLRPLSLRALSKSYRYRPCLEHLRGSRELRMGRRSRTHEALRSPVGAKLRNYFLHRLRFTLASPHSERPRNGHSCWLTRRRTHHLATGANILGLKSSVGLLSGWSGNVRRAAAVVAIKMPPNLSLNPDASPAALTRRPLGAGQLGSLGRSVPPPTIQEQRHEHSHR